MARSPKRTFPTLAALLAQGTVWCEDGSYVGKAADGVVVSVGTVGCEKQTESYLSANPTPADW
jgi:hypothetical protein